MNRLLNHYHNYRSCHKYNNMVIFNLNEYYNIWDFYTLYKDNELVCETPTCENGWLYIK
jgi:hypothetical protein